MALTDAVTVHLPLQTSLLKNSTSLELAYDTARMGMRVSIPRRFSKDKKRGNVMAMEASCEVIHMQEPSVKEEKLLSLRSEDMEMIRNRRMMMRTPERQGERKKSRIKITDLPEEVQQNILGFLVGHLGSISSKSSGTGVRNWNYALRHTRGKDRANLALVTPPWTRLIQERLYRHIRIQGTTLGLHQCHVWFLMHPHLQEHVRHVDIWVPVWERRNQDLISMRSMATTDDPYQGYNMQPVSSNYRLSSNGASIEEMFHLIQVIFKKACVLTIEGGACKKPPRIPMTRCVDDFLPELSNIKTLVLKGTWTMIRDSLDLSKLASALPNLKDWQFMFASPKYYAYILMHALVPKFSAQLTHLHICMDGFYSKKWLNPTKVENLRLNHHLCASLGKLLLQLEALTFSGRACYSIFTAAIESCSRTPTTKPRLKSLDLALRNCCRDRRNEFGERMGMYNWGFINAFEKLVVTATASLKFFANLASMRIRFVDLDSPMASLNPYFQIKDQTAYGLYSEDILYHLNSLPIPIDLAEESISEDQQGISIQEKRTSGRRPNRIHISEYGNLGSIR